MDITVKTSELTKALSLIQSIVEKRTTMPILANVLLSAGDGQLRVAATDLEITAITKLPAEVREGGSTTVNAKVFSEIVRELPEGNLSLKLTEGERLGVVCQNSKVRIIGVNAEEYPTLPGIAFDTKTKISAAQLAEMISKTLYSVSSDETRFNLNGVCFSIATEGEGKKAERSLRMVATDGHRLAMITRPAGSLNFEGEVIVPKKGLSELRKLLDEQQNAEVGIDIKDGFLILETASSKISMRLIDGEFPDYRQVLPREKGVVATLPSGEVARAMKRVALLVTDKGKCVRFDFAPGKLRISSSSPELGDASEELAIGYQGESISIGFNAKYVHEMANSIGEDKVLRLELNGPLGPGKFYAENDESYIGIVMPMRLS